MSRTPDNEYFLKNLNNDGTAIGNKALREKLKWDEDKYWKIRDELLQDGLIKKATGKGGAVVKIEIESKPSESEKKLAAKEQYKNEKSLYKPFKETIELKFTKDMSIKNFVCQDINSQGRRPTGGLWTRPDIILVSVNSYSYYPGKVMDLISFELKHYDNISVSGVYETAAHSRFATKSYFCLYLPTSWEELKDSERIKNECERFGVGLMYFTKPDDYETYEIMVEPERRDPDPADIDEFIRVQLGDVEKKSISEMLR